MTFVREHDLASEHPIALAGKRKADAAVKRLRKSYAAKAEKLRAKAEKMLEEASDLGYLASKFSEYETPFATLREKIEDAAYWEARAAIGIFERDDKGEYLTPAPQWNVTHKGEFIGVFSGEERYEILRQVCPAGTEGRNWGEFEVEKVAP